MHLLRYFLHLWEISHSPLRYINYNAISWKLFYSSRFIGPNNVSQTSCFEELKAKTRYRRVGGKKRAAGGKSVGDVKLGNHATYQGPYLQLVQDDSLNISETLTFPSANISFVSSIYHYFSQHGTVSEMCLIKKFFLQI